MKTYTLAIISTFGSVYKWLEADNMEELQKSAYEHLADILPKIESREEINLDIMYTSDLHNRACYVPILWHMDVSKDSTPQNFFKI